MKVEIRRHNNVSDLRRVDKKNMLALELSYCQKCYDVVMVYLYQLFPPFQLVLLCHNRETREGEARQDGSTNPIAGLDLTLKVYTEKAAII